MRPWKKLFFFVLTDNLSVRRGLTDNLWVRSPLTDNLSVRRPLTDNLSIRRGLTDNLSARRCLTDNLPVRRGLTDNLPVRRGLTDNLSVRRALTGNLSVRRPYRKEHILVGLLISKKLKREWQGGRKISNELKEKAKKWVHSCGRKRFTIDKISKYIYGCSLSIVRGNG